MKQIFVNVDCLTLPIEEKRKVRKDFDLSKRYNVDVSECTIEEKKEVQQAFFDAGFQWMSVGKDHKHLYAMRYTNMINDGTTATRYLFWSLSTENCNMSAKEFLELVYEPEKQEMKQIVVNVSGLTIEEKQRVNEALAKIKLVKLCNPLDWGNVVAMYGPSSNGVNVGFDYYEALSPTHTPQQVLEMAGMTTKRKVRTDFNPEGEYRVDVSMCSEKGKKEVQQAFFDVGFPWVAGGHEYQHLHAALYTNVSDNKNVTDHLMYNTDTKNCNMTAKEFLDLVYEPENRGHVHAELMAQYAEDAKTHTEPWKLWEYKIPSNDGVWYELSHHPYWATNTEFRRKPKTHYVHGVAIPDLRIKKGSKPSKTVVCVDPLDENLHVVLSTDGISLKRYETLLDLELLYEHTLEGQKAAVMHATAMLGI